VGLFQPTNLTHPIDYAMEVANVNTFVLWANVNSPELNLAIHNPKSLTFSQCYPPTEPSVFYDGTGTLRLVFGCVVPGVSPLTWQIKSTSATHPLFLDFSPFKLLIDSTQVCSEFGGFQCPSLFRLNGQMYLSVSPSQDPSGDYGGCLIFPYDWSADRLSSTTPAKQLLISQYHTGSCSGGDGSFLSRDAAAASNIVFFHAPRVSPTQSLFYKLHEVLWANIRDFSTNSAYRITVSSLGGAIVMILLCCCFILE
jgi:hypothetical protein